MGGCHSLVCTRIISRRALRVGSGKANSLSNLPGLRRAGSRLSGRLVAPMTITWKRAEENVKVTENRERYLVGTRLSFIQHGTRSFIQTPQFLRKATQKKINPLMASFALRRSGAGGPYCTFHTPEPYINTRDSDCENAEQRHASYTTTIVDTRSCLINGVNPPRNLLERPRLQGLRDGRNMLPLH